MQVSLSLNISKANSSDISKQKQGDALSLKYISLPLRDQEQREWTKSSFPQQSYDISKFKLSFPVIDKYIVHAHGVNRETWMEFRSETCL